MATRPNKTIELWDRYTVTVNTKLLDDFDFISDLSEAHRTSNISELVTMYKAYWAVIRFMMTFVLISRKNTVISRKRRC